MTLPDEAGGIIVCLPYFILFAKGLIPLIITWKKFKGCLILQKWNDMRDGR